MCEGVKVKNKNKNMQNYYNNFNKFIQPISNKKYFKEFFIFFLIISLSQLVFYYDEEKVVALCLISFGILFYNNLNTLIYDILNEKAETLEAEFKELFEAKFKIMWKLRIYWRLFLDLEDNIVELYWWSKNNILKITILKNKNINMLKKHWLKDYINFLLDKKFMIQKNLQKLFLNFLIVNIYDKIKINILNYFLLLKKPLNNTVDLISKLFVSKMYYKYKIGFSKTKFVL